jgi:hypothetical protein
LAAYLVDILPYGNPLLACMTQDATNHLHFVGRVGEKMDQLTYRRATSLSDTQWRWGAWERVPFPVPFSTDTRLAMYALDEQIFLVWTTATVTEGEDSGDTNEDGDDTAANAVSFTSTISIHFAVRSRAGWTAPQECHVIEEDSAVSDFHLLMYEVSSTNSTTVPVGLYVTLDYGKPSASGYTRLRRLPNGQDLTPESFGGAALLWSPTLRRFRYHDAASSELEGDVWTGGQIMELEGNDEGLSQPYLNARDARYQHALPRYCNADGSVPATLETIIGPGRTERLGLVDDTGSSTGTFQPGALNTYTQVAVTGSTGTVSGASVLFPPNFGDWASQAPFVASVDARS